MRELRRDLRTAHGATGGERESSAKSFVYSGSREMTAWFRAFYGSIYIYISPNEPHFKGRAPNRYVKLYLLYLTLTSHDAVRDPHSHTTKVPHLVVQYAENDAFSAFLES